MEIVTVKIPQELFYYLISNLNEDIIAKKETLEELENKKELIVDMTEEEVEKGIEGVKLDGEKTMKLLEILSAQKDNVKLVKG